MTKTELKNAIATKIAELRANDDRAWECYFDVIDYTDAAMYGEGVEAKDTAFAAWAERTGYWDKLQKYAYDDIDMCGPENIDAYLGGVNDYYGLTVDFEQEYKDSCLQRRDIESKALAASLVQLARKNPAAAEAEIVEILNNLCTTRGLHDRVRRAE